VSNGTEANRQSVVSVGLEILKTQGVATVVLLMVIFFGREAGMKWLQAQNMQVAANVSLTKQLGESLNQIVECQRESINFQAEVRAEHRQQTELLIRACDLLQTLTEQMKTGKSTPRPPSGGS